MNRLESYSCTLTTIHNTTGLIAVVLAGGLGTRLRTVLPHWPKVLAEVEGQPFLKYLLDQLAYFGIREVVLCIGYLGEQIENHFGGRYKTLRVHYSKELQPLGTAGALRSAFSFMNSDTMLVMNGDSYCEFDLRKFTDWHINHESGATVLLTHKTDSGRYGTVLVASDGRITDFVEKKFHSRPGWINAGVYLVSREMVASIPTGCEASLERDIFPTWLSRPFFAYKSCGRFIDIGTPESYREAEAFFQGVFGE